jgi:hypothetical protein
VRLGDITAYGDRRRAIAATQDGVFHADFHLADLRQRNLLTGRADQGEVANPARIEPSMARKMSLAPLIKERAFTSAAFF